MTIKYCDPSILEGIARQIIVKYDAALLNEPMAIPVETIMEKAYGLKLDYQYIRNNGRILGETVFEDMMVAVYERENREGYKLIPVLAGTVLIDATLLDGPTDGRFRYTCAHELAHWIFHKGFFTQSGEPAAQRLTPRSSETDKAIEWQADRLASYLLMPKGGVKKAFYRSCGDKNAVASLAAIFGVSHLAMSIRLSEMRLLM